MAGQQGISGLEWELLLIDNNSTDTTVDVARGFTDRLPLRYVFEPEQGLSAARNLAIRKYRGELLIFTDDDVVLDAGWLAAWASADAQFADAAYFGGRILPLWEGNRPRWLVDPSMALISGLLVHYDLGDTNRLYETGDPSPFGANFALRRELIEGLESFRLDLGVKGGSSGRGEEAEYLDRARAAGARGAYVGAAACYHMQDPRRFELPYLYRYGIEKGRAEMLMTGEGQGSRRGQATYAMKGLGQLLRGRGDRFRQCVINMGIQRGLMVQQSKGRATSDG
jgi:glycosyltransferase involved in cell wall biosynthesis